MFGLMKRSTHNAALLRMHDAEQAKLNFMQEQLDAKAKHIARLDAEAQRLAERVRDLRAAEAEHKRAMAKQARATEEAKREANLLGKALDEALLERDDAREALRKIAGMVTPGSAPIGKRMAKVAADHLAGAAGVQAEAA